MTIGEQNMLLWKKKLSQAASVKAVGRFDDIIGRYKRGIIIPSFDVILKIADALYVSIDFLVGRTSLELDKKRLERLEVISNLSDEDRNYVLKIVDMVFQNFKTQKTFAS